MESTRQSRISKQIQKDMADILRDHTSSLAPGKMITVTKVNITPDLGLARVNISVFPSEKSEEVVDKLNLNIATVRHDLGNKMRHQLKKIPELKFYLDDSLDYIENIDNLLKE